MAKTRVVCLFISANIFGASRQSQNTTEQLALSDTLKVKARSRGLIGDHIEGRNLDNDRFLGLPAPSLPGGLPLFGNPGLRPALPIESTIDTMTTNPPITQVRSPSSQAGVGHSIQKLFGALLPGSKDADKFILDSYDRLHETKKRRIQDAALEATRKSTRLEANDQDADDKDLTKPVSSVSSIAAATTFERMNIVSAWRHALNTSELMERREGLAEGQHNGERVSLKVALERALEAYKFLKQDPAFIATKDSLVSEARESFKMDCLAVSEMMDRYMKAAQEHGTADIYDKESASKNQELLRELLSKLQRVDEELAAFSAEENDLAFNVLKQAVGAYKSSKAAFLNQTRLDTQDTHGAQLPLDMEAFARHSEVAAITFDRVISSIFDRAFEVYETSCHVPLKVKGLEEAEAQHAHPEASIKQWLQNVSDTLKFSRQEVVLATKPIEFDLQPYEFWKHEIATILKKIHLQCVAAGAEAGSHYAISVTLSRITLSQMLEQLKKVEDKVAGLTEEKSDLAFLALRRALEGYESLEQAFLKSTWSEAKDEQVDGQAAPKDVLPSNSSSAASTPDKVIDNMLTSVLEAYRRHDGPAEDQKVGEEVLVKTHLNSALDAYEALILFSVLI